ncbi:MAG: glycosyltransferase family 2 protein [Planctomycetota bacterium]
MDVSIIVVNWNTCDFLRACLKSVYQQAIGVTFEVIVVDNASADGSAAMVESEFPQVKLIQNDTNKGFAAANNEGITIAKGKYVLLLNSDTVILNNAIDKTISFADAHPKAGVVGCRVLNPDRTLQLTCFMFPSVLNMLLSATYLYKVFPRNRFFGRERITWWNRDDEKEVDVVTGCFMFIRRQAIEQVGVMDERFFVYGEETDWCYRSKRAGWKVLFTPEPQIIHFGGQSSKQIAPKMALQLRGSILQFMHKHHSWLEYKLACFLVWLFFVMRIPAWFIKWLVSRKNRAYCWSRLKTYIVGTWRLPTRGAQALCVK